MRKRLRSIRGSYVHSVLKFEASGSRGRHCRRRWCSCDCVSVAVRILGFNGRERRVLLTSKDSSSCSRRSSEDHYRHLADCNPGSSQSNVVNFALPFKTTPVAQYTSYMYRIQLLYGVSHRRTGKKVEEIVGSGQPDMRLDYPEDGWLLRFAAHPNGI